MSEQLNKQVIIFDGVCNLCDTFVHYVIKRDVDAVFRFAPLQTDVAKNLLADHYGKPFGADTVVLIKDGVAYDQSDAVLEILRALPRQRFFRVALGMLPKPVRDYLYRVIAKNRYRIFGKKDQCMIPTATILDRFL